MHTDDHDIRILVESSAKGDAESYGRLYEHLIDRVYRYLRFRTATEEIATDLAQDTFISLYAALPNFSYRSRAEFYAYVFQIVRRTLARHYGDKHTQGAKSRTDVDDALIPDAERDPLMKEDLERALQTLEPLTREIMILHHWSGYTFGEIGAMLHLTESATRVRHHRALETLRTYFNQTP
jgi:RNA polymerase sigma-70 factor, ECF subfamily